MPRPSSGARPAAEVGQTLDRAGVPNILWGWWVVSLLGVHYGFPEIEFVLRDDKLAIAVSCLIAAGYQHCTSRQCVELHAEGSAMQDPTFQCSTTGKTYMSVPDIFSRMGPNRFHVIADEHFHFDPRGHFTVLRLYKQSRMLWWLPKDAIKLGPVADEYFMLSNDEGLPPSRANGGAGTGPWRELPPVKIMRPAKFFEALVLLRCLYEYAADWSEKSFYRMVLNLYGSRSHQTYREIEAGMRPEFRSVWVAEHSGPHTKGQPAGYAALRLRKRLLAGQLEQSANIPPLPPLNIARTHKLPENDVDPDLVPSTTERG
ncbi:hypothetical protein BJX68DRAFT_267037 [Aspergillus pseudodeflectus]|uniref:Uncharacterized protein n=1 Tax=Aspergillus pseudodeflectus TaxID=176178 RepID=A0ABR4KBQ4_9EURO